MINKNQLFMRKINQIQNKNDDINKSIDSLVKNDK